MNSMIFGIPLLKVMQVACAIFLSITFLQSSLDKLFDYKGNKEYFTDHFKDSILRNSVPMMLPLLTLLELSTGILSFVGIYFTMQDDPQVSTIATTLAMFTFLCLFFGQRVSKDYAGAAGIVPYIIFTLVALGVF